MGHCQLSTTTSFSSLVPQTVSLLFVIKKAGAAPLWGGVPFGVTLSYAVWPSWYGVLSPREWAVMWVKVMAGLLTEGDLTVRSLGIASPYVSHHFDSVPAPATLSNKHTDIAWMEMGPPNLLCLITSLCSHELFSLLPASFNHGCYLQHLWMIPRGDLHHGMAARLQSHDWTHLWHLPAWSFCCLAPRTCTFRDLCGSLPIGSLSPLWLRCDCPRTFFICLWLSSRLAGTGPFSVQYLFGPTAGDRTQRKWIRSPTRWSSPGNPPP